MPRRRYRRAIVVCLLVVALLALGRYLLPDWLLGQVNSRLGQLDPYQGQVQDIDLFLLTGSYVMKGVVFEKSDGEQSGGALKVPLLSVDAVRFSLKWRALLRGRLEGQVELQQPVLNLVDGPDSASQQFGTGQNWQQVVEEAYPLTINYVRVVNGETHFRNFHSEPNVDIALRDIQALAANLRNRAVSPTEKRAEIRVGAVAHQQTPVSLRGTYQWLDKDPDFAFDFEMEPLPVGALQSLARVYANVDPAAGTLALTAKIRARDRQLDGYVQPLFENLEILDWEQDAEKQNKNPFQLAWEGLLEFFTTLLENKRTGKVGAKVPISGEIGTAGADVFPAVLSSLRNAFGKALNDSIKQPVQLPRIEESAKLNGAAAQDARPSVVASSQLLRAEGASRRCQETESAAF